MTLYVLRFGAINAPNDPLWYARSAERIGNGNGFTVDIVYPIAYDSSHPIHSQPEYVRPPLYSYLLASLYLVLPNNLWVTLLGSVLAYIALVPVVYQIADDWFGISTACWAAAMTVFSPFVYTWTVSALTHVFFAILIISAFSTAKSSRWILCGGIISAAYLTRGSVLTFLPPILLYAYVNGDRADIARVLGSFASVASPYWLRNIALTGNPLFSYQSQQFSRNHQVEPYTSLFSQVHPVDPFGWILAHPAVFLNKTVNQLLTVPLKFFDQFGGGPMVFFAAVGILVAIKQHSFDTDLFATIVLAGMCYYLLHR